jgi:hypothetical protein
MSKLIWGSMQAALPGVQQWGAQTSLATYVITCDRACIPDDVFYGRFAVSVRELGRTTRHLGAYDTLDQAKAAAEASRRKPA